LVSFAVRSFANTVVFEGTATLSSTAIGAANAGKASNNRQRANSDRTQVNGAIRIDDETRLFDTLSYTSAATFFVLSYGSTS